MDDDGAGEASAGDDVGDANADDLADGDANADDVGDNDGTVDPTTPPDRAFALLGDETRVAILRALHESPDDAVAFSTLRERVGSPDSGQFNYHLGELTGHFVASADGGYGLTQAGREVVRAVLAGSLTERPATGPGPVDGECPDCGAPLVARYDEHGVVECPECGATVLWNEFPPAGLADRSSGEFARALDRWTRGRFRLAMDGICPSCAAGTATDLPGVGDEPFVVHGCENCGHEARVPLFAHAIYHPAAVAFYHDRATDVTDAPFWELRSLVGGSAATVESEDPWRATVRLPADDGEWLRVALDESLSVTDVERSRDDER